MSWHARVFPGSTWLQSGWRTMKYPREEYGLLHEVREMSLNSTLCSNVTRTALDLCR